MRRGLLYTTIDEALLSAISFGGSLVLIRWTTQHEFGAYALLNGLTLLVRGVQNAMVVTPLTTSGSRLSGEERSRFIGDVRRLDAIGGLLVSLLLSAGTLLFFSTANVELAFGLGLAMLGTWRRELERSVLLLNARNAAALQADAVYAAGVAGGVALLLGLDCLRASTMFMVTGAAALVPSVLWRYRAPPHGGVRYRETLRLLVGQGRWTLPGTLVLWAQSSGYAWIVSGMLDTVAVAKLATARLFIMPIMLLLTAWGRLFLPRAGALIGSGDGLAVKPAALRGLRQLLAVAAAYYAAVLLFIGMDGVVLLSPAYADIGPYVGTWAVFSILAVVRGIASNALLAHRRFRDLFLFTCLASPLSLLAVCVLVTVMGLGGAVVGLCLGELILVVLTWQKFAALTRPSAE